MKLIKRGVRAKAGAADAGLALIIWTLTVAAKPAAKATDDDWTMPAIIVGVMAFLILYNVLTGKGVLRGEGGDGGDGCGGGCGGGD
jgi:hypothetical protein